MSRSVYIAFVSAAALIGAGAALPAFAQTQVEEQVVTYGDLDLDRAAGADALLRRIGQASENVCGERTGPRSTQESRAVNECRYISTDDAVRDVGHPVVTARYYGSGYAVIEPEGSYDPYVDPTYATPVDPYAPKK